MQPLNEHQIKIMRDTYGIFKELDNKQRHLKAEREIYKQQPGYRPFAVEEQLNAGA